MTPLELHDIPRIVIIFFSLYTFVECIRWQKITPSYRTIFFLTYLGLLLIVNIVVTIIDVFFHNFFNNLENIYWTNATYIGLILLSILTLRSMMRFYEHRSINLDSHH